MKNDPESLSALLSSNNVGNAMSPEMGVESPPDEDEIVGNLMDAINRGDSAGVKMSLRAHRRMLMDEDGQVDDTADMTTT